MPDCDAVTRVKRTVITAGPRDRCPADAADDDTAQGACSRAPCAVRRRVVGGVLCPGAFEAQEPAVFSSCSRPQIFGPRCGVPGIPTACKPAHLQKAGNDSRPAPKPPHLVPLAKSVEIGTCLLITGVSVLSGACASAAFFSHSRTSPPWPLSRG